MSRSVLASGDGIAPPDHYVPILWSIIYRMTSESLNREHAVHM